MQSLHLYAWRMDVEPAQLRCLVAVVEQGTFTDAAIALGVSQAAVSRSVARLEAVLGRAAAPPDVARGGPDRRRVPGCCRTPVSCCSDLDRLVSDARSGQDRVRLGYAWSAVGRHTVEFTPPLAPRPPRRRAGADPDELPHRRNGRGTVGPGHRAQPGRRPPLRLRGGRAGTALRGVRGGRPVGAAAVAADGRLRPAADGHRPPHRDHHHRPVAGRGPARPTSSAPPTSTTGSG